MGRELQPSSGKRRPQNSATQVVAPPPAPDMAVALTQHGICLGRPRRHPTAPEVTSWGSAPVLLDPIHRTEVLRPQQLFQSPQEKSTARRGRNDRHLDCWQPRQETHQDSHAPLPKLLLLFPTHGRGPRRAHRRGQHQAEGGRRCHQAPWRSLGDPAPTAPTAAGFAHGPAVPRTRSCYTRTVGHIAGCRRRGGCEPCRGRAAE